MNVFLNKDQFFHSVPTVNKIELDQQCETELKNSFSFIKIKCYKNCRIL